MMNAWPPTTFIVLLPAPRLTALPLLPPSIVPPFVSVSLSAPVRTAAAVALPPRSVAPAALVMATVKPLAGPSTTMAESFCPRIRPPALLTIVALP